MRTVIIFLLFAIILTIFPICKKNNPQQNLIEFSEDFFKLQIPEMKQARLLSKSDLPERQQYFFEEADGQLQLLIDLNKNGIPEYVVTGVSESSLQNKVEKERSKPYFIAIFEAKNNIIKRLYFQQVYIPPVNLIISESDSEKRIIISFAFSSSYGAEIYYKGGEYHLERW